MLRLSRNFPVCFTVLRAAVALIFSIACVAPTTGAETDGSSLTIYAVDAVTRSTIQRVSVRVVSDRREYDGLTDRTGMVRFEHLPAGTYGVFAAEPAFEFATTFAVTVVKNAAVLTVAGKRVRARVIGSVEARTLGRADPSASTSSESNAAAITGSVGSALSSVTALGAMAPSSPLTLHNEKSTLTGVTLNGAPLFASDANLASSIFSADIFSSASVERGSIGAPDGTLNFQTYEPVIDWEGVLGGRAASFGSHALTLQERGTTGRFGLSAVHAERLDAYAINGETFGDLSGQTYSHDASQRTVADTFGLRYGFTSDHTAHLDLGRLRSGSAPVCTYQTGPLPCGYGSGNRDEQSAAYAQLRDSLPFLNGTADVHLFVSQTRISSDLSNETILGKAVGSSTRTSARRAGALLNLAYPVGPRRSVSLTYAAIRDDVASNGAAPRPPSTTAERRSELTSAFTAVRTRRFLGTVRLGTNSTSDASALTYGLTGAYALSSRESLSLTADAGRLASRIAGFEGVNQPRLLQVECNSGRALGNGPSESAVPGATKQVTFNYQRRAANYQIDAGFFRHIARDALITGVVPGSALSPSLFTSAYFDEASTVASAECSRPVRISPTSVSFTRTASVSRLINDGLDAGATFDVNRRANIVLSYSASRQRALGPSSLSVPGSTVLPGRSLPDVSYQRLEILTRYGLSRASTVVGDVRVFGGNNPYARGAFASLNVGLRARVGPNDVVAAVENLGNVRGRPFGTFDPYPFLRLPYPPRSLSIRMRFALGRQDIDRADYLTKPVGLASSTLSYVPVNFESTRPEGWLNANTSSEMCGPESKAKAQPYLSAIAQLAKRTFAGNIQQGVGASASVSTMTVAEVRTEGTHALRVSFDPAARSDFGAFLRCATIHEGNYDQAKALGLYTIPWQRREAEGLFTMYYAPAVGLYMAPDPVNETSAAFVASDRLPAVAPRSPFAVVASCPSSYAASIAETVSVLKASIDRFYRETKLRSPEGFTLSAHTARAETWLEIRADSTAVVDALNQCLDVPAVKAAAIKGRGLDSAFPPSLNYAPSVGFYSRTS